MRGAALAAQDAAYPTTMLAYSARGLTCLAWKSKIEGHEPHRDWCRIHAARACTLREAHLQYKSPLFFFLNAVRAAAAYPLIHTRTCSPPVTPPYELVSARRARIDNHFFTVDVARHCDDLPARQHALVREQLLWRHALLHRPVTAHRNGGTVAEPCSLHRVKRRHGRTAKCVLETWL